VAPFASLCVNARVGIDCWGSQSCGSPTAYGAVAGSGSRPAGRSCTSSSLTALTTAGAAVAWDDRIPGRRRFFTSDPWGNRIELLAP